MLWRRRRGERLRPLDEAAAYARCHGAREETVRVVKLPPRRPHYELLATGEEIRRRFEELIDARDGELEAPLPSGFEAELAERRGQASRANLEVLPSGPLEVVPAAEQQPAA